MEKHYDLPLKSMGFLDYASLVSRYCHGNKPPLELHATFARTLHEVYHLLFPLSICFLSHSSTSSICFNHFPLPSSSLFKRVNIIVLSFLMLSFSYTIFTSFAHLRISKLKLCIMNRCRSLDTFLKMSKWSHLKCHKTVILEL